MPKPSKLLEANPALQLSDNIYKDAEQPFRESTLSNYLQIAVAEIYAAVDDKSLHSIDIEASLSTDELRYELDSSRFNYLLALNLDGVETALDLSEDLGSVAHYLANTINAVDAVKIDPDRARLSAVRCAELDNINHITENVDNLSFPKKTYDLIVLGQLEALGLSKKAQSKLLKKLRKSLTKNGVLVANVKNQCDVTKWFDSAQSSLPYQNLYQPSNTLYTLNELENALETAAFSATQKLVTFSKGEKCQQLFAQQYLQKNQHALNHFYRLGSITDAELNEYLFFKQQQETSQLFELGSRFIIIAGTSENVINRHFDYDFCHFAGTSRKPRWRTITAKKSAEDSVEKTSLYPGHDMSSSEDSPETDKISQNLESQDFLNGPLLVDDWLQAALHSDAKQFEQLVLEYSQWLETFASPQEFAKTAYDALPFNIVLEESAEQRTYQLFDSEWQVNGELTSDFVLFRALFWFAFENKSLLKTLASKVNAWSLGSFILHFMPGANSFDDLTTYAEREEKIQLQIAANFRHGSVRNALLQSFSETAITTTAPQCQVAWANRDGVVAEADSVEQSWQDTTESQSLVFKLPAYSAEMPLLRIDPINSRGIFLVESLKLLDADSNQLWQFDGLNSFTNIENAKKLADTKNGLAALNSDPYLLFDVSEIENHQSLARLKLTITLLHDENYDGALATLADAVGTQNRALAVGQSNLNRLQADIDFLQIKLADAVEHRADINGLWQQLKKKWDKANVDFDLEKRRLLKDIEHINHILIDSDRDKRRQVHVLLKNTAHLRGLLNAQIERNDKLEQFLTTRPSARIKRFVSRQLQGIRGGTAAEVEAEPEPIEQKKETGKKAAQTTPASQMKGELIGQNKEDYQQWLAENSLSDDDIAKAKQSIENMKVKPNFSIIVPIYNTDPEYLMPMIRSVQAQIYPHWQLCLVDDASPKEYLKLILEHEATQDSRISLQMNTQNQGISLTSNDALAVATGDYIGLLDHDDEISIDALYENAKVINERPEVGLIYSDEDKMDLVGNRLEPFFKPDYSPDLLNTNNYVCHFTVIRKDIVDKIGGFREGLDGSQDHDIILRAIDEAKEVVHIPKLLYHWRKIPGSTAVSYDSKSYAWEAGRRAVEECLAKKEDGVRVEFGSLKGTYRVYREIQGEPLVSIIIPFKDKPKLLKTCIDSILLRSLHKNFEIIGVNNSSESQETFDMMESLQNTDKRVRFVEKNIPFNFSALCNFGVEQAKGDYVVLLNNDIEVESPDWIERLLEHAQCPQTGAVGGKLLYPDNRIQHAGVVVGMVGAAGHPHKYFPDNHIGYHGRLHMVCNVSAVTGAMLMIGKQKYEQVGGLDEELFAVAYNDIDFCLKLHESGYYNVFTPHCRAVHHESLTRGYEDTDEKLARLKSEQNNLHTKWQRFIAAGDPYYNPNLSLENEHFSLNFKDGIEERC